MKLRSLPGPLQLLTVAMLLAALVLTACQASAPAPAPSPAPAPAPAPAPITPVKLRLASNYPQSDPTYMRDKFFMDEVTKRTNGAITFETFWASALADPAGSLDAVQKGAADIIDSASLYWAGKFPTADLFHAFPFGPVDPSIVLTAKRQIYNEFPEIQTTWTSYNVQVLAHTIFPYYRMLTNQPINSLADLNGKKMGVIGKYFGKWMEPVGIAPVVMASPDRYQALQSGLLDIDLLPITQSYAFKLYEVTKYLSTIEAGSFSVEGLLMNMDALKKLSPETQKIIMDVALESETYFAEISHDLMVEAENNYKTQGITTVQFPAADMVTWANKIPDIPAQAAAEKEALGVSSWQMAKRWQEITTQLGYQWSRQWAVKP